MIITETFSNMETPESAQHRRAVRNHTPRLSERKKKLFCTERGRKDKGEEEELLNGIEPLSMVSKSRYGNKTPKSAKTMESLMGSCKKSPRVISFFETESEEGDTGEEQKLSPSRRSVRLSLKRSPNSSKSETEFSTSHKENVPIKTHACKEAKKLQKMFTNSMQITPRDKSYMDIVETSSDDEINVKRNLVHKKHVNKRHCEIENSSGLSPARKVAKTSTDFMDGASISTKSFYSDKNRTPTNNTASRQSCRNLFGQALNGGSIAHRKTRQTLRRSLGAQPTSINRGVHHKVRNRMNMSFGSKHYPPVDIDQILNNVRNEKLRKLITARREEKQQIEKIHNIFRKASNPIAMARPLSSISNEDDSNINLVKNDIEQNKSCDKFYSSSQTDADFSDIECDQDEFEQDNIEDGLIAMNEDVIPLIKYHGDDTLSLKSEDCSAPVKKKIFKSGCSTSTRKEIHLTGNIKATLTANGKLAIVPEKNKFKKRIKIRNSVANEFSDEQATVDAILRNLDDSAFDCTILSKDNDASDTQNLNATDNNPFSDEIDHQLALMNGEKTANIIGDIVLEDEQDFNDFRKRLPYNTTDPEIIERQHLLLDFLITNNICNEDNFKIFIGDPDNYKEEAERIIDELVIVVTDNQNSDFRQRIPYNTTDVDVIEQQHRFLDFLLENNICTEENFDIFIANYIERKAEAIAILSQYIDNQCIKNTIYPNADYTSSDLSIPENINLNLNANRQVNSLENNNNITTLSAPILQTSLISTTSNANHQENQNLAELKLFPVFYAGGCQPLPQLFTRRKQQQRLWNAGYGSNQYQIDAGQKAFGAHQCKQCGLVYTVHEPEEEKLHRDFHASLHILRFKGWIDEDIVAIYPEWGADGRILRLTESSPSKRRERLSDILKIVDKELGFSSYIIPKTFVAYFAVRKMQIVGLCLIQPLNVANKYICVNGVDCCSEDQFEAKCGVSRIWVSPLHRRFHIATKLIQAVQLNTIFGEEVPLDKIAFSAPTELGKVFAQKITKTEHFLVYQ